ncbi:MAG: PEP/pyruvate-binding domain-containing protein [Candidatus Limnocylindrales bacterium]
MFGRIVLDVERRAIRATPSKRPRRRRGAQQDTDLDAAALRELAAEFRRSSGEDTGRDVPGGPRRSSSTSRSRPSSPSWFGKRAADYRKNQSIPHDLGTAVNVVTMVFGNMGDDSGTGVAFTRDPNTGEKVLFGEYLTNAQGEDVVAGIRTAPKIAQMQTEMPEVYAEFQRIGQQLEQHYRDVQDLEFTIERGRALHAPDPRAPSGPPRPPCASPRTWSTRASITEEEALARIEPAHVDQLLRDQFDPAARKAATAAREGPQRVARAPPSGRRSSTPTRAVEMGRAGRAASSSSGSRPRPTTSTAWPSPRAS